jgi:hypothetical protein
MMTDANSSGHLPGWEFGWSRAVFLAVTMLLAGTAPAGTALAGMDRPAVIVPVDTPITVDGDDQEWRGIQAQQTIFQGGKPVTQFKLAADKTAFYACAHVRDTSPLLNNTKILQEVIKGGDAIGFCFLYGKKARPRLHLPLRHAGHLFRRGGARGHRQHGHQGRTRLGRQRTDPG